MRPNISVFSLLASYQKSMLYENIVKLEYVQWVFMTSWSIGQQNACAMITSEPSLVRSQYHGYVHLATVDEITIKLAIRASDQCREEEPAKENRSFKGCQSNVEVKKSDFKCCYKWHNNLTSISMHSDSAWTL